MVTALVNLLPITGSYDRTLSENDNHRLSVPPQFIDRIIQRNYASLPFYINEKKLKVTPSGILFNGEPICSFGAPLAQEAVDAITESPIKIFTHIDAFDDSTIFGTVNGQELECRAWMDYLIAQSEGRIRPERTYQMDQDTSGRMPIPKEVRGLLGIEGTVSVLLMGMADHFTLSKQSRIKVSSYKS